MKSMIFIFYFSCIILLHDCVTAQIKFHSVSGNKGNYTLDIPPNYYLKESIGANIDLKFVNPEGASIITVVKKLPDGLSENSINAFSDVSDQLLIDQYAASGLENISIIKRGFITINNIYSYFIYFTDGVLYHHSITQWKNGINLNLTYTCELKLKTNYLPYIFRVTNSLKHF
ncbi:MAG: hypothetical protein IPK88_12460 [Saprospiraceae bacterium]|nr:hypothetical protein [Candidatus Defluviibacterium haderslevense]